MSKAAWSTFSTREPTPASPAAATGFPSAPAFPGLLDRETGNDENTLQALDSRNSRLNAAAKPGSGKTSLLRHLAHQSKVSNFAAGVIYFQVHQQSNA